MTYANFTIHLPDHELLERVKVAAKEQGITPGAFFRQAGEKAVAEHERKQKTKRKRAA